jgi:hypothetical protein
MLWCKNIETLFHLNRNSWRQAANLRPHDARAKCTRRQNANLLYLLIALICERQLNKYSNEHPVLTMWFQYRNQYTNQHNLNSRNATVWKRANNSCLTDHNSIRVHTIPNRRRAEGFRTLNWVPRQAKLIVTCRSNSPVKYVWCILVVFSLTQSSLRPQPCPLTITNRDCQKTQFP